MKLRTKTLIHVGISVLVLGIIIVGGATYLTLNRVSRIEMMDMEQSITMVRNNIKHQLDVLYSVSGDWSNWNDTWYYIQKQNPEYIKSNVTYKTFENLQINTMIFLDTNRHIVFSQTVDPQYQKTVETPSYFIEKIINLLPETPQSKIKIEKGYIVLADKPAMVIIRPVLRSDGTGTPIGYMVWSRWVDESLMRVIFDNTSLKVKAAPYYMVWNKDPLLTSNDDFTQTGWYIKTEGLRKIHGYGLISDVMGKPGIVFQIDQSRDIFRQGIYSVIGVVFIIIVFSLFFFIIMTRLLQRLVLNPVTHFESDVAQITETMNPSGRLKVISDDELGSLGNSINKMLTALEKSQNDLFELEGRSKAIVEQSMEAIVIYNFQKQTILRANEAFYNLTGLSKNDAVQSQLDLSALLGQKKDNLYPTFQEILDQKAGRRTETVLHSLSGISYPVEISIQYLSYHQDEVLCLFIHEITERKQAEMEIREARDYADLLLQLVPNAVFSVDLKHRITLWNKKAEEITGISAEEIIGKECPFFNGISCGGHCNLYEKRDFKPIRDKEVVIERRNGEKRVILKNADHIYDSQGHIIGGIESFDDITEKKTIQESLISRDRQMSALLQIQQILQDAPYTEYYENKQGFYSTLLHILGPSSGASRTYVYENEVSPSGNLYMHHTAEWCMEGVETTLDNPALKHLSYDGFERWRDSLEKCQSISGFVRDFPLSEREILESLDIKSILILPLFAGSHFVGFIGFDNCVDDSMWESSDIELLRIASGAISQALERYDQQALLNKTLDDLKRSNEELEQFAYVASHDLQEPLRMVTSYVQLLSRRYQDKLDDDGREFIGFAVDGALRMKQLITDLLSFSRLGTRAKPLKPTDCQKALEYALNNLSVVIHETNTQINVIPLPVVMGDETQLIQLFQNLIGNAVKFRRKDVSPVIQLKIDDRDNYWVFHVIDNGMGIKADYYTKIFVIFKRLHRADEIPGTGIGLALCKRIVERHHGKIWVDSVVGEGSVFSFSLPKYQPESTEIGFKSER